MEGERDDAVAGARRQATPWRASSYDVAPPGARSRPARDRRGLVAGLLAAALLAGAWRLGVLRPGAVGPGTARSWAADTPPPEPSTGERLLPAVRADPGEHRYALLAGDARWDPCRPVHYAVRQAGAPAGGAALLADAVARLSLATGLALVQDPDTAEAPSDDRRAYQPDAYGRRWAPVLVAWAAPEEQSRLAGDVAGFAGAAPSRGAVGAAYDVSGQVVLDGPQLARVLASPAGEAGAEAVLLHELGHLVGLDHVEDRSQLMNPSTTRGGPVDYAAG